MSNIFIERCIATVLVSDYEKKRRKYIGLALSFSTVIFSVLLTPVVIYGTSNSVFECQKTSAVENRAKTLNC